MLAVLAGYLIFGIAYALGRPIERPPLDPQSLIWILPWLTGLTVISYLGQYGGTKLIPPWVDLAKLGPTKSVRSSQVWCSRVGSDGRSVDGARSTAQRQRT
jgi:hypothetical protein